MGGRRGEGEREMTCDFFYDKVRGKEKDEERGLKLPTSIPSIIIIIFVGTRKEPRDIAS